MPFKCVLNYEAFLFEQGYEYRTIKLPHLYHLSPLILMSLCVVKCLEQYLNQSSSWRGEEQQNQL